jgi:hypothetical protein
MKKNIAAGQKLHAFRVETGLSYRDAILLIGCAYGVLYYWENGIHVPAREYRMIIELITNGEIPASEWGKTPDEKKRAANLRRVREMYS